MARKRRPKTGPRGFPIGPPLPPTRARRKRRWGEGYIFRGEIGARDYVVVEEVFDDNVGIVVAPWPQVDAEGGLVFGPAEQRREAVVDRASFQRRLSRRRVLAYDVSSTDPTMQSRPLSNGDVFAIETSLPKEGHDLRELEARWIRGSIVDVTAMARDAAKAAMLAALTGEPLSLAEAATIAASPPSAERPRARRR